jgi:uncharacterized protein (DUF362 family)
MKKTGDTHKKVIKALGRREFLKSASIVATAAAALPAYSPFSIIARKAKAQPPPPNTDQVKVIVARDSATHEGSLIQTNYVKIVMDEAIRRLTAIFDTGEAYKSVLPDITLDKVIGIKVNCINSSLPTHPEVVDALIAGLLEMKVEGQPFPANNIIIWDRTNAELAATGYTLNTGTEGVRCFGTDQVGINYNVPLNCNGYTQYPSMILTDYIDYHIDFAVMKNAGGSGLTMTLKNNFGCISAPWDLHASNCDPGIPAANQQIRDEVEVEESLFIVDAIFACTAGGPSGPPNLEYDGIIMGVDRVAVDSIGRSILEEYGCQTLAAATHVDTAAGAPYFLGSNDLNEIHRLDVNNPSEPVGDLVIRKTDSNILLRWTSSEYTGYYKVLRSPDPNFSHIEEIGMTRINEFMDRNIMSTAQKYFYRVLKTW